MIGMGKTVSEIAAELALSVKTVSTYRARILEKMDLRTTAELMHYVIDHGLCRKAGVRSQGYDGPHDRRRDSAPLLLLPPECLLRPLAALLSMCPPDRTSSQR